MTFDPDAFLAGIRPSTATVTIFNRPDLAGKLDSLEAKINAYGPPEQERDMTEGAERAELVEEYNRTVEELGQSKQELTLQDIAPEVVDEIRKEARAATKERADQAAKDAIAAVVEDCKRSEITDAKERKEIIRRASSQAVQAIINYEVGIRTLARSIVNDNGDPAMSVEQCRAVMTAIGEGQRQKVLKAFYAMSSVDPGMYAPKSLNPGRTAEG